MEAFEANSIMLRLRNLREELNKKFGQLAVNAQVTGSLHSPDCNKNYNSGFYLTME
ncbi:UNVERIFIED_CONTAM: hypothetical protein Sradi_4913800 [Sesamum radiatum]|uniref:Uncharacterized protein n=1 Tax=Sesamum radiatum TaxID=300843 RepID=A0AAW2MFH8_SESRA